VLPYSSSGDESAELAKQIFIPFALPLPSRSLGSRPSFWHTRQAKQHCFLVVTCVAPVATLHTSPESVGFLCLQLFVSKIQHPSPPAFLQQVWRLEVTMQ